MPRSQCETENIQFVQELAEVDGPFESPININFRDLTKLELPSLVWNRGDSCPKKMKITNTGHTVIISGKWKCERPYLTGGPLAGKYVFSQIHFHWGQDDSGGSEHQVCGDGFPLEMHVAHFKTEYLTQESALREKDGMVVVVYLFKLQEEPNQSLKKIIGLLPSVKQPSTSHAIDPRPILSFCHPFTDDYFMYWGSVVTSTCAHILLWIICREPFGISREQVNEFRKIMDSSQQPICRNSRDIQPLHKRNVFHVNASKHLDDPLLPVKKLLGCYCKDSEENIAPKIQQSQNCKCHPALKNQEECEGGIAEFMYGSRCLHSGGFEHMRFKANLRSGCFHRNQTYFVHRATVHSLPVMLPRFGSEPSRNHHLLESSRQLKPEIIISSKFSSKSCSVLPFNEYNNIQLENRTTRVKKPSSRIRAFHQIMHSLETLKNHTFKKLKEIESLNQEIKGMETYCRGNEDRRWLQKLEKIMRRQKRFTIKSSQGCLSELKKLAKDCNLDKIFDYKALPTNEDNGKLLWLSSDEVTKENLSSSNAFMKQQEQEGPAKNPLKSLPVGKAYKFSAKAQKLIQSFFEDIQDTDELQETVKEGLNLKKIKGYRGKQAGDAKSVSSLNKGFITPNMFLSGNLGDRFFTEVTVEDFETGEGQLKINQTEKLLVNTEIIEKQIPDKDKNKEETDCIVGVKSVCKPKNEDVRLEQKEGIIIEFPKAFEYANVTESLAYEESCNMRNAVKPNIEILSDVDSITGNKENKKMGKTFENYFPKIPSREKSQNSVAEKPLWETKAGYEGGWMTQRNYEPTVHYSTSNSSTESTETQRMVIAKIRRRRSRRDLWEQNSSDHGGKSYTLLHQKSCKEIESYYVHKRNHKTKKRKKQKYEVYGALGSREPSAVTIHKWKSLMRTKAKLEIEKPSEGLDQLAFGSSISPRRKKLKLESRKVSARTDKENSKMNSMGADQDYEPMLITEVRLKESHSVEVNFPKDTNEWKDFSGTTIRNAIRGSSLESKTSFRETCLVERRTEANERSYLVFQINEATLNMEIHKNTETKLKVRSRSLTGMPTTPKAPSEIVQRLYLESLEDRRKNNKETPNLRRQLESPGKKEERVQIKKDINRGTLTDNYESEEDQKKQETQRDTGKQNSNTLTYDTGLFTAVSSPVDEELLPQGQQVSIKNPVLKRCDAEKYQFLEKRTHALSLSFQQQNEECPEIAHQTEEASKNETDTAHVGSKDLQTSVSYLTLKKNSPSRPHSAETLTSLTKTFKRKGKKRPHCCKRISRHYIRKNSSIFKKPNKTESKTLNFLSLTDQEQLKIISVNVAKYLKQKLIEENEGLDPGKTSIHNIEEAVIAKLKSSEPNEEERPRKETDANKQEKKKQNKLPVLKRKEKKLTRSESKTKTESASSPNERKNEKGCVQSMVPKPANNFIKLNKQMAGKYKKRPAPAKEEKPKQEEKPNKPNPESNVKNKTEKFKTRIPKKRVEKSTGQKVPEQEKKRAETPSSPKSQELSQTKRGNKETRNRSLVPRKVRPKNNQPTVEVEESTDLVTCEQTPVEGALAPFTLQTSAEKTHFVPAYMLTSYLPTPIEIVDTQNRKVNRYLLGMSNKGLDLPDVMYEKGKKMDGNDPVFKKELEYFIKLEMLDISANVETSRTYAKSSTSQDYFAPNFIETNPVDERLYLDPYGKEIVLLKMKDVECSSSCSDSVEETDKYNLGTHASDNKNDDFDKNKNRNIITVEVPKESGDSSIVSPQVIHEKTEEINSDSSYDCKISITLNTNFSKISEQSATEREPHSEEGDNEMPGCQTGNSNSLTLTCLGESSSHSMVVKHHRRKRKENEISLEMKHKLLEILEGEIRREAGMKCDRSSGNSSEGLTFRWEDSDGNCRSTGSSCDNIEVLTQISDTMRQYLQSLKEKGQLVDIISKSYEGDSK